MRLTATVDGESPAPGYHYRWLFGDGTVQETSEPTTTHHYQREGPWLPRLALTADDGRQVLSEAAEPVAVS